MKRRTIISLLFLLSFSDIASGQDTCRKHDFPILTTPFYNKGVYKTFAEFKYNNPSIKVSRIKEGLHALRYRNTYGQKVRMTDESWGYCDGSSTYIWYNGQFNPFYILGVYCCFATKFQYGSDGENGDNTVDDIGETNYFRSYNMVLDIRTGEITRLRKSRMHKLLEDDSRLYWKYKNERNKRKKLKFYIIEYNRKNA